MAALSRACLFFNLWMVALCMPFETPPSILGSQVASSNIDSVSEGLSSLKTRLHGLQHRNEVELLQKQADFVQSLKAQEQESHTVEQTNLRLRDEIRQLESKNADIRQRATDVKSNVDNLRFSVAALGHNLSAAKRFGMYQLQRHQSDARAPEIDILKQLDAEDADQESKHLQVIRLKAIESTLPSIEEPLSLLQVANQTSVDDAVKQRLQALQAQHSQSLGVLTHNFNEEYKRGGAHKDQLLGEQRALTSTKASLLQRTTDLSRALSALEKTESFLRQREAALRGYMAEMGSRKGRMGPRQLQRRAAKLGNDLTLLDPAAPVLLQVASTAARSHGRHRNRKHPRSHHVQAEEGPAVPERYLERMEMQSPSENVLSQSVAGERAGPQLGANRASVFESVSSKVKTLEAQLEEAELENKQTLSKHRVMFEQNLNSMRSRNLHVAKFNAHLVDEIEGLKRSNQALRDRAEMVREDTKVLREDLSSLRTNLSAAIEFTAGVLDNTAETNATQVKVLDELKQTDASRGAIEEHEKRLQEIAETAAARGDELPIPAGAPSFLQTAMVKDPPKALLQTLNAGFEALKAEHDKHELELKKQFSDAFAKENDRYKSLLQEQRHLNQTKQQLDNLSGRLQTALAHLESTRKVLEERGRSLRVYAQRLGIRPFPHQRSVEIEDRSKELSPRLDASMEEPEMNPTGETARSSTDYQRMPDGQPSQDAEQSEDTSNNDDAERREERREERRAERRDAQSGPDEEAKSPSEALLEATTKHHHKRPRGKLGRSQAHHREAREAREAEPAESAWAAEASTGEAMPEAGGSLWSSWFGR